MTAGKSPGPLRVSPAPKATPAGAKLRPPAVGSWICLT